jgi:Leucine-rich repeat (LRR) protein
MKINLPKKERKVHAVIDILRSTPDVLEQIQDGTEEVHIKMSCVIRWIRDSEGNVIPKYEKDLHRFEMAEKWRNVSLEPLANIDSLHTLNIEDIGVMDFAPLSRMTGLRNLRLHSLRADSLDLSPIGQCNQLQEIEISGKMKSALLDFESPFLNYLDLRPLGKCDTLKSVHVGYSNISYFSLPSNPSLETLDLSHNNIVTKLMILLSHGRYEEIEGSRALNLSQLEGCDNLSNLNLKWNGIWAIDISPLSLLHISPKKPLCVYLGKNGEMADQGAICVDGVWRDPRFEILLDRHVSASSQLRVVDVNGNLLRWGL